MSQKPAAVNTTPSASDPIALPPLCSTVGNGGTPRTHGRADALSLPDTPLNPQALLDYRFLHCMPSRATVFAKTISQRSFFNAQDALKKNCTARALFLADMEHVAAWAKLITLIGVYVRAYAPFPTNRRLALCVASLW